MMVLYEFLNTSNQTSPYFEMHENIIDPPKVSSCAYIHMVDPKHRCKFLTETNYCLEKESYIQYFHFVYCTLGVTNTFEICLAVILLICLVFLQFIVLECAADKLFCPCVRVFSHVLGLNENVAGITLLTFSNCAPELFGTVVHLKEDSRASISDLYGSCMFVSFFVAGFINYTKPFKLDWFIYLRDAFFLLLSFIVVQNFIKTDFNLNFFEGVTLVCLYLTYIGVVFMDLYLMKRKTKRLLKKVMEKRASQEEQIELNQISKYSHFHYSRYSTFKGDDNLGEIAMTRLAYYDPSAKPNAHLFTFFLWSFALFDHVEYQSKGIFRKMYMLISLPFEFLLTALVPIVDYEMDNHGWSKLLNCIQIVVMPFLMISQELKYKLFGVPWCLFTLLVTIPSAVILFLTSRADIPPRVHILIAFLTLWASIFLIQFCANEIISLLNMMGVLTYRNSTYLGCTLLALSNSIGDLIANVIMARNGYPIMGFSACFGAPIFNCILIIGMASLYKNYLKLSVNLVIEIDEGTISENVYIFTVVGLLLTIFIVLICNFRFRRCIGAFLLMIYAVFCIFSTFSESDMIHPYGTFHSHDEISYPLADEIIKF